MWLVTTQDIHLDLTPILSDIGDSSLTHLEKEIASLLAGCKRNIQCHALCVGACLTGSQFSEDDLGFQDQIMIQWRVPFFYFGIVDVKVQFLRTPWRPVSVCPSLWTRSHLTTQCVRGLHGGSRDGTRGPEHPSILVRP